VAPAEWHGRQTSFDILQYHPCALVHSSLVQELPGCAACRHGRPRRVQEWRHQNGMRALGIPNNKNFFEVTQIKDALELWTSIQARRPPARPPAPPGPACGARVLSTDRRQQGAGLAPADAGHAYALHAQVLTSPRHGRRRRRSYPLASALMSAQVRIQGEGH